jgi:ParB family chromosome partitioning protein
MDPTQMHVVALPLDRITMGERLRPVDPDWVALLAASIAERGQDTPIQVSPADRAGQHRLIAGAHRLAALRQAGIATARATIFRGSAAEARLLEIDENLMRRELSALDRAVFLAERKRVYEELHPETRQGENRRTDKFVRTVGVTSFAKETAEKLGLSDRHIRRAIKRSRIEPELRARLATTRWADHGATLDALARAEPATRRRLVEALTRAEAPAASLAAARAELGERPAPRTPEQIELHRLMEGWRKAGRAARRQFFDFILDSTGAEMTAALMHAALTRREAREEDGQSRVVTALAQRPR